MTYQILTNHVQMLILCPSYFITAVLHKLCCLSDFSPTLFVDICTFFSYEIVKELKSQDLNM